MVIKILIALAVIVIVLVAVVAMQPSESPWAKRDPGMKHTYGGAAAGTGATYAWAGNREVGEGRMTLMESRPSELIRSTSRVVSRLRWK